MAGSIKTAGFFLKIVLQVTNMLVYLHSNSEQGLTRKELVCSVNV